MCTVTLTCTYSVEYCRESVYVFIAQAKAIRIRLRSAP